MYETGVHITPQTNLTLGIEPEYKSPLNLTRDRRSFIGSDYEVEEDLDCDDYRVVNEGSIIYSGHTIWISHSNEIDGLNESKAFALSAKSINYKHESASQGWISVSETDRIISPSGNAFGRWDVYHGSNPVSPFWHTHSAFIYMALSLTAIQLPKITVTDHLTTIGTVVEAEAFHPGPYWESLKKIKSKFEKEFSKYSNYIRSDKEVAKRKTETYFKKIAKIEFKDIAVELTPSNTIKFTILLDNEKMLVINGPFEKTVDLKDDEVVYSIFKNRELLISDVKNIDDLIEGIIQYKAI